VVERLELVDTELHDLVLANEASIRMRKILANALAMIVGTERMIVCKDVLQLDDGEAHRTKRRVIRALVEAARKTG
jgi:hypothetical protein